MMAMTTTPAPAATTGGYDFSVGTAIPANMAHAVSVSLPKWQDNVDYEEGRLGDVMQIGYPRFFVHKSIQKLAAVLLRKFGTPGLADHEPESCYLFPSARVADRCRSYMRSQYAVQNQQATSPLPIRVVQFSLVLPASTATTPAGSTEQSLAAAPVQLYIVLFPASAAPIAKSYWQHTGDGISSRLAEHCLSILEETGRLGGDDAIASPSGAATPAAEESPSSSMILTSPATAAAEPVHRRYSKNRHYSRGGAVAAAPVAHALANSTTSSATPAAIAQKDSADPDAELMSGDQSAYVEERYGRNLPASSAPLAKRALRRRIAGTLLSDRDGATDAGAPDIGPTAREGTNLSENDVFLYPSGMSSIFHAHQVALRWRQGSAEGVGKSVCFGFPYTDTLKILQKWGPGCHFFGKGSDAELDELEQILKAQGAQSNGATSAPILALFCEFPSNPLLRCPDLPRIRRLADQYDFLVVVDETIGNFLNVEVLPYADLVVSSLTKVFSGDANVMGGSMVVNPKSRHAGEIREVLVQGGEYEDNYWGVDAVFMERNSRDFARRVQRIDANAEALATMLHSRLSISGSVVKGVYYPKFETRAHYDACRRQKALPYPRDTPSSAGTAVDASIATREQHEGGFGGLFSVIFTTLAASQAFYDALSCAKGPSLGTNFTLASPYTLLAHYNELDWAKQFGVEATLVRVSTGLEETEGLVKMFERALEKAEEAEKAAH